MNAAERATEEPTSQHAARPAALGLRLQIGLSLAGLFVLGFVPLFFAVASLTHATLASERRANAKAMGRVVAARVAEAQASRTPGELVGLMDAQLGTASGLYGIAIYDSSGSPISRVGDDATERALPARVEPGVERVRPVTTRHGPALEVTVPGPKGSVVAVLRTDEEASKSGPLVRLVGLYTLVVGVALLLFVYFALTRLVIHPLGELSRSAKRVASRSGRSLEMPRKGAAELIDLASTLSDMTGRLRAEEDALRAKVDELVRVTRELKESQAQLLHSERLASVGRLAAGLAHEVGNPLAAIIGLQELLVEGGLTEEEERDFVLRMRKETERIHRILRDLLDYARPTTILGRPEEPGSVDRAFGDVVNLLRPQKDLRDVDLAVDTEADLPLVPVSHEHLVQIVLNLVSNAAEATGPNGHVTLRARSDSTHVTLEVEDDGPGIDASIASTLFEPFTTTKDVGKGTGLGLAVCRGLVEGASGTICTAPREGGARGARFVVTLPIARASASIGKLPSSSPVSTRPA